MRSWIRSALIPVTMAMLLGSGAALAQSNVCKADLNGDAVVNFGDLAIMKSVFFQSCPRFEDRGLTIFDHQTGLEWEKKTTDGGIHDKDNGYTWTSLLNNPVTNNPDGTAFTVFLAGLNGGNALPCVGESLDGVTVSSLAGYAGHCDWRLPTIGELMTIVDCSYQATAGVCINPIFGPTQERFPYVSSTSFANGLQTVWDVFFSGGILDAFVKYYEKYCVRAVRGGN